MVSTQQKKDRSPAQQNGSRDPRRLRARARCVCCPPEPVQLSGKKKKTGGSDSMSGGAAEFLRYETSNSCAKVSSTSLHETQSQPETGWTKKWRLLGILIKKKARACRRRARLEFQVIACRDSRRSAADASRNNAPLTRSVTTRFASDLRRFTHGGAFVWANVTSGTLHLCTTPRHSCGGDILDTTLPMGPARWLVRRLGE